MDTLHWEEACPKRNEKFVYVGLSDIPQYLHRSDLYKILDVEDHDTFVVPTKCLKENMIVNSVQDLHDLIHTVRNWGLDVCLINSLVDARTLYTKATTEGHLPCLHALHQDPQLHLKRDFFENTFRLTQIASSHGHLECLKFLHEAGCSLDHCAAVAAAENHVDCLRYIVQHNKPNLLGFTESVNVCMTIIKNDRVACLQCLDELYCTWHKEIGIEAATWGALKCLKYFHERGGPWEYAICEAAALNGHLKCLQYAHDHGCPLAPTDYQKCHYHSKDDATCLVTSVAQRKHWNCVQYLLEHNCAMTRGLTTHLVISNKHQLLQVAVERGCPIAEFAAIHYAKTGNVEGLRFVLKHGCACPPTVFCAAAQQGYVECMKRAFEYGCEWSVQVCVAATRSGNLDCLQYAHEHGCPWDGSILQIARCNGYQEIVDYCMQNGCPRNS